MFDLCRFALIIIWIYTIARDQIEMSRVVANGGMFSE